MAGNLAFGRLGVQENEKGDSPITHRYMVTIYGSGIDGREKEDRHNNYNNTEYVRLLCLSVFLVRSWECLSCAHYGELRTGQLDASASASASASAAVATLLVLALPSAIEQATRACRH
jgi:hypothetical protein